MITIRWFICLLLVSFLLHLLAFAVFGQIALWTFAWFIKVVVVAILSVPIANWIVGD